MGAFDYTTKRFVEKIDYKITAVNAVAANLPESANTPPPLETDRAAIEAAVQNSGFPDVEGVADQDNARVVFMKNSAEMQVIFISECLVDKINDKEMNNVSGAPFEIPFDHEGKLTLNFSD
jgi:hypothetical protein